MVEQFELINHLNILKNSFKLGNAIKNGVSTVIAGRPNAGKSTLLNNLKMFDLEQVLVEDV